MQDPENKEATPATPSVNPEAYNPAQPTHAGAVDIGSLHKQAGVEFKPDRPSMVAEETAETPPVAPTELPVVPVAPTEAAPPTITNHDVGMRQEQVISPDVVAKANAAEQANKKWWQFWKK